MRFSRVRLKNWKNFTCLEVPLERRVFCIGANASGKSNFLDAFRFLRDVAEVGLQRAVVELRGGLEKVRSLFARSKPAIEIEVTMVDEDSDPSVEWQYSLHLLHGSDSTVKVKRERVLRDGEAIVTRPDSDDRGDPVLLTQTHLEQVRANKGFRPVADFFRSISYLHIVPQLMREAGSSGDRRTDPFGRDLLLRMGDVNPKELKKRLGAIGKALKIAVPNFQELRRESDSRGVWHLRARYEHWRPKAGWQTEDQFSDGTLRLVGLLWALLDGSGLLLLEEPELSLHDELVRRLPQLLGKFTRPSGRQVFVSTHSRELLSDSGVSPSEVLVLRPKHEGTAATILADDRQLRALVDGGLTIAEVALSTARPRDPEQLLLFGS